MALSAIIFRFTINISDLNRHYYQLHTVRVAQHPSENEIRMLIRVIAFALFADERLGFTSGLCVDDEPELWIKNDTGEIALWVDLGMPDSKRLKKASVQSERAVVMTYGGQRCETWWQKIKNDAARFSNLSVIAVEDSLLTELAENLDRSPELHCVIEENQIMLTLGDQVINLPLTWLQGQDS